MAGYSLADMEEQLRELGVVPVIVIEDADDAVPLARALVAGGLPVIEITMRTEAAPEAIRRIAGSVPEATVGAGTVLNAAQAETAVRSGAAFVVSPGLHQSVVEACGRLELPLFPGVATASEVQAAWNMGLRTLKFFPAGLAGGVPMLKALCSVFRDISFMPTGGVSPANLGEYLALPGVAACGGSWLAPGRMIAAGDFDSITGLAREARVIVAEARG